MRRVQFWAALRSHPQPGLQARGVGGGARSRAGQTAEYVVSTVEREGRCRGHAPAGRPSRMMRKLIVASILLAFAAVPASAQKKRGLVWDDRPSVVFGKGVTVDLKGRALLEWR